MISASTRDDYHQWKHEIVTLHPYEFKRKKGQRLMPIQEYDKKIHLADNTLPVRFLPIFIYSFTDQVENFIFKHRNHM